jgi:hypothetical protein
MVQQEKTFITFTDINYNPPTIQIIVLTKLWKKVTFMINKIIPYSILASFFLLSCTSKDKEEYDTRAIASLDEMSQTIGELSAASYTLNEFSIKADGSEKFTEHDVYMRGPNKMYVHSVGTNGDNSYWYDGENMSFYSFEKNLYATIEAPDDIIQAVDFTSDMYGIDFPATDFFYPDFTDDILNEFDYVLFVGDDLVDGIESTSVFASNDAKAVQIWVNKTSHLPLKLVIESKVNAPEYYEITFSNFRSNPDLPDLMFDFKPPVGSESTEFKSTEQN